ncbi:NADH dehydrogenase subunit 6 (mitochondrion) [Trichechus manatus]|uniref:NADH-ubiquinone oxidoreductase chain 6 n=2 Tax=Trichechus manatus TaxID=9778 RepID=A0A2Y9TIT7_TRIMA|nr:NADH dehydrogenase subunit 6 [Trichechus manatus]QUB07251.1 NADH dehydrogenase subunit 6 [Trichechus manatus manatus]CAP17679.1 NADH dehydrogenase subunit 6 [Trichechus manatus]
MMYVVFMMSVLFVVGFIGFSSKPSPIYGGLGLIVSGGVGCGVVVSLGGSFLGLMVFLVYLGGMMVVFGYTTAMATDEYPETWGSNVVVLGALITGLLMEGVVVVYLFSGGGCELVGLDLGSLENWMVFGEEGGEYIREDYVGGSSLYDRGCWLMLMSGWMLFISVFVVIEITRGR